VEKKKKKKKKKKFHTQTPLPTSGDFFGGKKKPGQISLPQAAGFFFFSLEKSPEAGTVVTRLKTGY
jgi:hypothetical protein